MVARFAHKVIITLLLFGGLIACASSLQLANRFVVEETDIHVLVLPPGQLIKTFLPEHPDSIASREIPEVDEDQIRFVNEVVDSIYTGRFMESMAHYLDRFYINIYGVEELDEFFQLDQPAYIFLIAQMELLEYRHTELFSARDGDVYYVRREPITVLENNTWFEFLKLHDADFGMKVLFSVQATSDHVEGRFIKRRSGDVLFDADRYPLTQNDLYDLAYFAGKQNAQNIFDYLMNIYVEKKMGGKPHRYYRYDVDRHAIEPVDQPGFIEIEPALDEEPDLLDQETGDSSAND